MIFITNNTNTLHTVLQKKLWIWKFDGIQYVIQNQSEEKNMIRSTFGMKRKIIVQHL